MGSQRQLQDTTELPRTYREHRTVDFKQDRKFAVGTRGGSGDHRVIPPG